MSDIRLAILWLRWIVFRKPSVVLYDHDGKFNFRRALGFRKHWVAKRVGLGIRTVGLRPNGQLSNGCYVERWEPLFPADFKIGQ